MFHLVFFFASNIQNWLDLIIFESMIESYKSKKKWKIGLRSFVLNAARNVKLYLFLLRHARLMTFILLKLIKNHK